MSNSAWLIRLRQLIHLLVCVSLLLESAAASTAYALSHPDQASAEPSQQVQASAELPGQAQAAPVARALVPAATPEPPPSPKTPSGTPQPSRRPETPLDMSFQSGPLPPTNADLPQPSTSQGRAHASSAVQNGVTAQALTGIPLLPGWNLISIPTVMSNTSPAAVLAPIAGQFTRVYAYDGCDTADPWKLYDPADAAASDLTVIDHRLGLWIQATAAVTLPLSGAVPPTTTIQVCTGWNLPGFPVEQNRPVRSALASIDGKYTRVFGHDLADLSDPWEVYDVSAPDWANDLQQMQPGRGYWVLASENATLTLANEGAAPVVRLISPDDTSTEVSTITFITDVVGTVTSDLLQSWTLSYRPHGEQTRIPFATGITPVTSATLGRLDPTLLLNGAYEIQLTATDHLGRSVSTSVDVVIEGQAKIGHVRLSFVDMVVPVAGIPINVIRIYDSRDNRTGDFGVGWQLDISQGSYTNNRIPGQGWQILPGAPPIGLPCSSITETLLHFTEIRLSQQEFYRFRLTLFRPVLAGGGCFASARFDFVDGTFPGATLQIMGNTSVFYANGSNDVLDDQSFLLFDPAQVRLTTTDGRVFDLDRTAGITRIQDTNNNQLTIGSGGIVHSSGKSVIFTRDGQGRIIRITDPLSNTVSYDYDLATGDLISVTNQVSQTTRFVYSTRFPHHLEKIINPDGSELTEFGYDDDGRVNRSCDYAGNCTTVERDLNGRTETVFDATGRHILYTYDERGNVLSVTDGLSNKTTFVYDANDDVTQMTDANGGVTRYTYDSHRNLTSITEPHAPGLPDAQFTTSYTYNTRNKLTNIILPTGAEYSMTYDAAGNQTALRDEAGNLLLGFTYGSGGSVTSASDPFGTTVNTYDAAGNVITSTDPFNRSLSMAYDAGNRIKTATDENDVTATFNYDGLGRETTVDYGYGITSSQQYGLSPHWTEIHSSSGLDLERKLSPDGRLVGWVTPGGAVTTYTHDAAGRLQEENDPLGNVTHYDYDAVGRIDRITDPLGATTTFTYDAVGQVLTQTNALDQSTSFTYLPDGRRESMTDALGHTWTYSYDLTTMEVTDPLNRTTTFVESAHGLPIAIIHPDGTRRTMQYLLSSPLADAEEFPTAITDEGNHTRRFSYDSFGQLIGATDLAGIMTTYRYIVDQLAEVIGPTGETLSYTHDELGKLTGVTYPDDLTKTITYAPNGEPLTVTLPSGTTISHEYDAASRPSVRRTSLGEEVRFEWNDADALIETQDATGITRYTYDAAGNITAIEYPGGAHIDYERNLLGQVITVTTQIAASRPAYVTSYGYNKVGNLTSVRDPLGGATTLDYDDANRLITRTLPNGVKTAYTYNDRDQVTSITHRQSDNTILASLTYERQGVGEPIRITREDGSYVRLSYDTALRLTDEAYYSAADILLGEITYAYDAAGNRRVLTDTTGVHTYSYQPGYQLTGVSNASGNETYTYDADGRVTLIARDGVTHTLGYDALDHLVSISDTAGAQLSYTYDGAGRRVLADGAVDRHFLVGPALGDGLESTHMVADAAGGLVAGYVYAGEMPIMRFGPSGPVYYLNDALGSVIGLANSSGASVARFEYDGFGNLRSASGSQSNPPAGAGGDFRFQGMWLETDTGLYYVRARDYDPRMARFLSRDAAEGTLYEPESLHFYTFANGNPFVYRDPTGLMSMPEISITLNVNQTLQSMRSFAVKEIQDFVIDQVREAVADMLARFLVSLLPFDARAVNGFLSPTKKGRGFEAAAVDLICGVFKGTAYSRAIWLQVPIATNGKPTDDGVNCKEFDEEEQAPSNTVPQPDFVISFIPPTSLRTRGLNKSYLVGDFKLRPTTIKYNNQYQAIINHAAKYGRRVALYITLYSNAKDKLELERLAVRERVKIFIISLR